MLQNKKINDAVLFKPNILIEASYRLTVLEQHLIHKLTGQIKKDDKDFKEYVFSVLGLIEEFGLSKGSGYNEIERASISLLKKPLMIVEDKRRLFVNFVSSADYVNQNAELILCFDPKLKPYLLQLQGRFKILEQRILFSLKRQYAIRLYELLKQYENMFFNKKVDVKTRKFNYEDFREFLALNKSRRLGVEEDMYRQWFNFKRIVLDPAVEEILNKETDIEKLWYERIPKRGKVQSITFKYVVKPNNAIKQLERSFAPMKRERLQRHLPKKKVQLIQEEREALESFLDKLIEQEQQSGRGIQHTQEQRQDIIVKAIKKIGIENWVDNLSMWYGENRAKVEKKAEKEGRDSQLVSEQVKINGNIDIYFNQLLSLVRKK